MTVLKKLFGKYLLITNTVSCGLMMAAADTIQQRHEHLVENVHTYMHNYMRTRNMTAVGLLQGPFHHWFYMMLDKILPARNAPSVVKKMCLDQTIASPTCLGIFFVGLGLMERRKIVEIYEELKLKLYDTWKVDCCFWPPTQCVNFFLIPLRYRVLYINFMTMIYDIFLSHMKYDAEYE